MGFLDNSTNNIIVDAVLTDKGREFLARNDGSFNIAAYAFGDDEVDYSLITKYGVSVGKEKIEKNTPVFESLTNSSHAQENLNLTLSSPTIQVFPTVTVTNTLTQLVQASSDTNTLTLSQGTSDSSTVPSDLVDSSYQVVCDNRFLRVSGGSSPSLNGNEATYLIRQSGTSSTGGSVATATITAPSVSDTLFTNFGDIGDKTQITTLVEIVGVASGFRAQFELTVKKTS